MASLRLFTSSVFYTFASRYRKKTGDREFLRYKKVENLVRLNLIKEEKLLEWAEIYLLFYKYWICDIVFTVLFLYYIPGKSRLGDITMFYNSTDLTTLRLILIKQYITVRYLYKYFEGNNDIFIYL